MIDWINSRLRPLKIGLALSGGTARAVSHVGAIKTLVENGVRIDCITGTSGGAIAAAAYAAGLPLDYIEKSANEMSWGDLASFRFSPLGFVSSRPIEEFMIRHFGKDLQFDDLKIPCAVVATDLDSGLKHIINRGSVARAVRISCTLPHFFLPVEEGDLFLVDGGLSEYLPTRTAREIGADFVIAVNLGSTAGHYRRPRHILQLFMQVNNLVARQNLRESINYADCVIQPDLTGFSTYDFDNSEKLIRLLEQETASRIGEIQAAYSGRSGLPGRIRRALAGTGA